MLDPLREWLLRFLKVPPSPLLPTDSPDVLVFRAGRGYYRYKLLLWGLAQASALVGLVIGFFFVDRALPDAPQLVESIATFVHRLALVGFILQMPATLAIVKLDFDMRWYVLSDRSLRIREGIVSLREKTMTFANIQQVSVRQNPIQRLFGISDLQVRSAGGGDGGDSKAHGGSIGESMHEAWFRGVDNAEVINTAVRTRVREHRDAGLGDPDEQVSEAVGLADAVAAASEVHDEARRLRRSLRDLRLAQPAPTTRRSMDRPDE